MRTFLYILTAAFLAACNGAQKKENKMYADKLNAAKMYYPFERWKESFQHGLIQYTPVNCNRARVIFDNLISELIDLGEAAGEMEKVALFKKAIIATNDLNADCNEMLIETGEREDFCDLTDQITLACGLDPKKYGGGEGLASEWRDW